jgi:hypothetical protein
MRAQVIQPRRIVNLQLNFHVKSSYSVSSLVIEGLEEEAELEGYKPGTPEFDQVLLAKRVMKCRELRGHSDCHSCQVFEYCTWARDYLIQLKYRGK